MLKKSRPAPVSPADKRFKEETVAYLTMLTRDVDAAHLPTVMFKAGFRMGFERGRARGLAVKGGAR